MDCVGDWCWLFAGKRMFFAWCMWVWLAFSKCVDCRSGEERGLGDNGKGREKEAFGSIGAFFTAIVGPAGYLPTTGERRVEIYLCVDAGGGRC